MISLGCIQFSGFIRGGLSKEGFSKHMLKKYKEKIIKTFKGKDAALQKKVAEVMADTISDHDAKDFDENSFVAMIEAHWELVKARRPGEAAINISSHRVEGAKRRKTVIDIVCDDMAFLVDSIAAAINGRRLLIETLVHPLLIAQYDGKNNLKDLARASSRDDEQGVRQSHIHVLVHEALSEGAIQDLEQDLKATIRDVCKANKDWKMMLVRLKEASAALEISKTERDEKTVREYCSFLDYLHKNNFTLLGYAEYKIDAKKKSTKVESLGLLKDSSDIDEQAEGFPLNAQETTILLPPVAISKSKSSTTVHRRVPMDVIAVKLYDEKGNIVGEKLFLGLFTSVTYSRSVEDIPFLRMKVANIIEKSGFAKGSHDYKALRHILEKYPRDELFQAKTDDLYETGVNILSLQERRKIALFTRKDAFNSYISCMVYVPRDRFGTSLRKKIVLTLEEELNGTCSSFFTNMDDSLFARGLFCIDVDPEQKMDYDRAAIELKLQELGQSWPEKLSDALENSTYSEEELYDLTLRYGESFPVNYTNKYSSKQAVFDIRKMETVLKTGRLQVDLYKPEGIKDNQLRLKVYSPSEPIVLSDVMPILGNMGLKSIAELPYEITPQGSNKTIWIHDFLLERPAKRRKINLEKVKDIFEEAFSQIWYDMMESDKLNRLVLSAEMSWRDVVILRTYVKYIRQARVAYSQNYIQETLTEHADIAKDLIALFHARLSIKTHSDAKCKKIENHLSTMLKQVDSLNEDRVLRLIKTIIKATLRTNFYQKTPEGGVKPYLSIKLDSRSIDVLPDPKPFREIFVYSTQVEGIHLRGDKIARGGLRWSNRHEDFRTEVLGLMKAQMVKNSVIVPMGSKGGFVVKTTTHSREEFMSAGVECYKTFIRGLLDITDNLDGDTVIPPVDVIRKDGDDPYLVVAADKGTATFSDIANSLSAEYNFWLGDAFASGGSAGYDHKKMGITARGAWESVKLHFRQLNHDTQTAPFEVVGVGDMGGDVFGNGMLLSEHIRLVGAFNHLHIFCDPNPDEASSYKERKRLFEAVGGWDQYDQKLLSKGGKIYSRDEKSLKLTEEIKARFDIDEDEVPPSVLLSAMLKARTDLLWFGGIGTYIKASSESDTDVGDKANDGLRVNANEVRARVVGEGANLGATQLSRIEFALKGGKINTDFIDNSGGVDSSDHEVNIKILLSSVMKAKGSKMDIKARNVLLEKMTGDIENHVLRHNYQQAQAVSLAEAQACDKRQMHEEFIQQMEQQEGLDRKIEFLPNADEIEKRMRENRGLTRPELAVLVSYAKIALTKDLLKTDIPDNPDMQVWLYDYFPEILRDQYKEFIDQHKLRREIIAMAVANSLVNRLGPTFVKTTMKKTGMGCDEIVKAYIVVREIFGFRDLWNKIEEQDNLVPAAVQIRAMIEIAKLAEFGIQWVLSRFRDRLDVAKIIGDYKEPVAVIRDNLLKFVSNESKTTLKIRIDAFKRDGLPAAMAQTVASLHSLNSSLDIAQIALEQEVDVKYIAATYFDLGQRFHIDWLQNQAFYRETRNSWEQEAIDGLIDKLYNVQAGLTSSVLSYCVDQKNGDGAVCDSAYWAERHSHLVDQIAPFFEKLKRAGVLDLPMLVVAEQRLRNLYGG